MTSLYECYHSSKDEKFRENLVRSVADENFIEAQSLLESALKDQSSEVRQAALEEIGRIGLGLPEQVGHLLLYDSNYLVRITAAETLGMLGNPVAVPFLLKALQDRNYLVRGWVANCLAPFPGADVVDRLQQSLPTERMGFVKVCMLSTLIALGDKHLLPQLTAMIAHRNYRIRIAAVKACVEVTDKLTASYILSFLKTRLSKEKYRSVRSVLCSALYQLLRQDRCALDVLEQAFTNFPNDESVLGALIKSYSYLCDEEKLQVARELAAIHHPELLIDNYTD